MKSPKIVVRRAIIDSQTPNTKRKMMSDTGSEIGA